MAKRILVVEDEPSIQALIQINLTMAGFEVSQAFNVEEAIVLLREQSPDLLLLDWNMPGRPGVSLLRHVRTDDNLKTVPVIMLTARDDELDKVLAFDSGADDYVTKPFRPRELVARVQSLLRRANREFEINVIEIDGLRVNHEQRRVTIGTRDLMLSPIEFKLLYMFVRRPMNVYSREQLLNHVWGDAAAMQERTVDVHVARLRHLMEAAGHHACIETVRSLGYRFLKRQTESTNG